MLQEKIHSRKERGQSMMEFAMGMVILTMLLAGVVDGGRALFTFMAIRDAAQEGALYGSTDPGNTTEIENRVKNSSDMLQGLAGAVSVSTTIIGDACTGNGIRVRVAYNSFPITMPFLGTILGRQTIGISASATNTILTPSCH